MTEAEKRRNAIAECLYSRRYDTIPNLAFEFHVSERTIQRDIQKISLREPIYTRSGRQGGVFMIEGYLRRLYLSHEETSVLQKFFQVAEQKQADEWTKEDLKNFKNIILKYSKPKKSEREKQL